MRNASAKAVSQVYTLVFFEAVARHGSLTRAADELNVTQSAVSKQVKYLEEALGFALFERRHRGVELTPAGRELLDAAQPLLQSLEATVARIRQRRTERAVSIVCTQAVGQYWLFPLLVEFRQRHPDITVNVTSTNDITERTSAAYDFGILYGQGHWAQLDAVEVFPEIIYPICSTHFDAPPIAQPVQIQQLPLVQLDPQSWRWANWGDYFAHFGVPFEPPAHPFICNQLTLAISACIKGVGVALAWDYIARDLIDNAIVRPLGDFVWRTGQSDYLVHARGKPLSDAAQTFKAWLLEHLQSHAAPVAA